ncbi:hypothetical protein Droror1_Dr00006971 [Drosera rotundifolia]
MGLLISFLLYNPKTKTPVKKIKPGDKDLGFGILLDYIYNHRSPPPSITLFRKAAASSSDLRAPAPPENNPARKWGTQTCGTLTRRTTALVHAPGTPSFTLLTSPFCAVTIRSLSCLFNISRSSNRQNICGDHDILIWRIE